MRSSSAPTTTGPRQRPPVDDQRFVVVIAPPEPPDVTDLALGLAFAFAARDRVIEVEPAEDQSLILRVQRVLPASGMEDKGVALEKPSDFFEAGLSGALGAPPGHALGRHEPGALRGLVELGVDAVDVRLFDRQLSREGVVSPGECLGQVGGRRHRAPVLVTASIRSQVSVRSIRAAGLPGHGTHKSSAARDLAESDESDEVGRAATGRRGPGGP